MKIQALFKVIWLNVEFELKTVEFSTFNLSMFLCVKPLKVSHKTSDGAGRKLEEELNEKGPGESFFIPCDIRKEQDLKVECLCP